MERVSKLLLFLVLAGSVCADNEGWPKKSDNIYRQMKETLERSGDDPTLTNDDTVPVMIMGNGYPVETHSVITADCYVLEVHRIPYGRNSPPVEGETRPVVFLQHGLLSSSADWTLGTPEKFLAYILADEGYDVWMGNYRGNTYSRDHCDLDPNRNEFWHFSWDQMAQYDLPAMLDRVMLVTGQSRLHYVGHSMGTTTLLALTNVRPEYMDNIIMANLLAPVAYVEHMISPIRFITPFVEEIEWIAEHLGLGEFFPSNWLMDILADLACGNDWLDVLCESVLFLICGFDPAQLNETLLDTIVHHTPAGASTFTVLHYAQEVNTGGFHHYDLGRDNEDFYGSSEPPAYDLSLATLPISLYWSQNDWLAQPADVLSLTTGLPNIFSNFEVDYENWNHLDYLWGIDARRLVYEPMMDNMKRAQQLENEGALIA